MFENLIFFVKNYFLYIFTALSLFVSFIKDKEKTFKALKIAYKKFFNILLPFLNMLIFVSIVLFLIPNEVILKYLGYKDKFLSLVLASFFGSITFMPGFIVFPLCGILLEKGVPYMVLSAFTTTLMMVGIVTFPIEKEYFGVKVTVIRNFIGFLTAIIVALITGFVFGEIKF